MIHGYGSVWTFWMIRNNDNIPNWIIQLYTPVLLESAHKEMCPKYDMYVVCKPNIVQQTFNGVLGDVI